MALLGALLSYKLHENFEEFLRMPLKEPMEGYDLSIRSASYLGVHDLVKRFILEDANCVNVANKHGWTPLMYAAQSGNIEVCQLLLQHGAQVEARNKHGRNAYQLAQSWGHKRVMELLQTNGTKNSDANDPK